MEVPAIITPDMGNAKRRNKRKKRRFPGPQVKLTLLGLLIVWGSFFLPWLDYRCGAFIEHIFGWPPSELVPGWRLPFFAREAEQAWVVRVAQIFRPDSPDRAMAWLVYLSPLAAGPGLLLLRRKDSWLTRAWIMALEGTVLFFLVRHLQQPLPDSGVAGLEVRLGLGAPGAAIGHGLLCLAALSSKH